MEFLTAENERLQNTIVSMRDEVTRLSAVVVAHRDCGLGGVVVPAHSTSMTMHTGGLAHPSLAHGPGGLHHNSGVTANGSSQPPRTAAQNGASAPVAISVSVPQPNIAVTAGSGFGY